jgi:nucleoside-triphosphatase
LGTLTVLAFALIRDRSHREKLQNQLSQLVRPYDTSADLFFKRASSEASLVQGAEHEIWIVQETGNQIIENNRELISSFLGRGGVVRIVVITPTEGIARLMSFRNHHTLSDKALITRSRAFLDQISSILQGVGADAERLEVRFIPYQVDSTSLLVDPNSQIESKRKAVIRCAGFRVTFGEKLDFSIQGDSSPTVFSHYSEESRRLFEHAFKVILLTGDSGSDKALIIKELISNFLDRDNRYLFWATTQEVLQQADEQQGYEVMTSDSAGSKLFATKQRDGKFKVLEDIWASVATDLVKAQEEGKILVVDQIGPLQLQSPKFVNVIRQILDDPTTTLQSSA